MTWCNSNSSGGDEMTIQVPSASAKDCAVSGKKPYDAPIFTCPSCGHPLEVEYPKVGTVMGGGLHGLPGLPAGVKFDPADQEILQHLEAKVFADVRKLHPLIDEFIPTIEGENGICYTHPEKLPGVSNDGQVRHFFHRPSKAYTTGTRKRRKVHTNEDGSETRWHKTGKTRPVVVGGAVKGFKKILVLYTNYGRQRKPEKTNWVMHQYHLGNNEEEKDGELVVSKIFFQTQPRQCGATSKDSFEVPMANIRRGNESINPLPQNTSLIEYYPSSYLAYDHSVQGNKESSPQFVPNLVVQGDGSSFIRLAPDTSKGNL